MAFDSIVVTPAGHDLIDVLLADYEVKIWDTDGEWPTEVQA